MVDMFLLILVFFGGSMMWMVPTSLAGTRRKNGKPAYWMLLAIAMLIEIGIALGTMQLSIWVDHPSIGAPLGPLLGATIAGFYYWSAAKSKDDHD